MKIRFGFVSNSSSASFCIPSKFLTDEQKELLLSLDDWKEEREKINAKLSVSKRLVTSENSYSKNDNYHQLYEEMLDKDEWHDSWEITERKHFEKLPWVGGSTIMDNGSLNVLMEKMGIDLSVIQWHSDSGVQKAVNPLAIEFYIALHKQWFDNLTDRDKEFERDCGFGEPSRTSIYEEEEEDEG